MGYHLNGFTPNLTSNLCPVEFDRSNFKFDRALNTGQIGWKFTEITLYACLVEWGRSNLTGHKILVKLGVNCVNSLR